MIPHPVTGGPGGMNLITRAGWQVGTWYTTAGELRVGRIQRGVERWGVDHDEYQFETTLRTMFGLPVTTDFDDEHKVTSVTIDVNGRIHVWAGMHNTAMRYARTVDPHTSNTWMAASGWTDASAGIPSVQGAVTYPHPVIRGDGSIWLYVRDRASGTYGTGQADGFYWTYDGSSWSARTMLFQGLSVPNAGGDGIPGTGTGADDRTNFSPYPTPIFVEPADYPHPGRMHMFWFWADHGMTGINWLPSYAYSDDGGTVWRDIDGTSLTVPMTPLNNLSARMPGGAMIRSIARSSNIVIATVDTANHGIAVSDTVTVHCTKSGFEGSFTVGSVGNPGPTSIAWGQTGADDATAGVGQLTNHEYTNRGPITVDPVTGRPHILCSDTPNLWIYHDGTAWVQEEVENPIGGITHYGRMGGVFVRRGKVYGLTSSGQNSPHRKEQRLVQINGDGHHSTWPVHTLSGDIGVTGWEPPYPDPGAWAAHHTIETLAPDGNRPRVFKFGQGAFRSVG